MTQPFDSVPIWLALIIAAFVLLGASLTLLGTLGLIRLKSFYERVHAPTLGTSWGTGSTVIASILLFSFLQGRLVFQEILIGIAVTVTTPVTYMLLGRAVLYREWASGGLASGIKQRKPETPSETGSISEETSDV